MSETDSSQKPVTALPHTSNPNQSNNIPLRPRSHPTPRVVQRAQEGNMPSQLQSDTARANGAKSHGPATPEGRAISSRNSLRHGLTAKAVVLPGESQEEFQALLDAYIDQFQPATGVESELVQAMAIARWRLNRIVGVETNMFSNDMVRMQDYIPSKLTNRKDMQEDDRLAWSFKSLAEGNSLAMLLRYEATLTRTYDRAFKQLDHLQRARRAAQPNEPKPVPIRVHARPFAAIQESRNEPKPAPTTDSKELIPAQPETGPSPQPTPACLP